MASSDSDNWICDIINDFIHSSVWSSPIQTFIDQNCVSFDYNEDDDNGDNTQILSSQLVEQNKIYEQYQNLVDSLLTSFGEDFEINKDQIKSACQYMNVNTVDETYEQLYAKNEFSLFAEMMTKRNLILQLEALVNLRMEHGLLEQTDTNDDKILELLMKATSSSSLKTKTKQENMKTDRPKVNDQATTIQAVPEEILREKLREFSINTTTMMTKLNQESMASTILSRQDFLKQQRDLIVNRKHSEREKELEKEIRNGRPQSAIRVAQDAMKDINQHIPNDELQKRKAIAEKLRNQIINKK